MPSVSISCHYTADFKCARSLIYKSLMLSYDIYRLQIQHKLLHNIIDKPTHLWQICNRFWHPLLLLPSANQSASLTGRFQKHQESSPLFTSQEQSRGDPRACSCIGQVPVWWKELGNLCNKEEMVVWCSWGFISARMGFILFCLTLESYVFSNPGVLSLSFIHASLLLASHTGRPSPPSTSRAGFSTTVMDEWLSPRRASVRGCKKTHFSSKDCNLRFCRVPQQVLLYQPYQDNNSVTSITRSVSGLALKETAGKLKGSTKVGIAWERRWVTMRPCKALPKRSEECKGGYKGPQKRWGKNLMWGKKKKNPDVGGREWEGGSRGRGHIYTYGRFKLLFSKNQHNTVEQLCVCTQLLSCAQLFASPWTVARQDPLSMEFSRQEYSSGLPFPTPGDLPDPGIKPESLGLLIGRWLFTTSTIWEAIILQIKINLKKKKKKEHLMGSSQKGTLGKNLGENMVKYF